MPSTGASTLPIPPTNKFKLKSQRFPDLMANPYIWVFLMGTVNDIKRMTITFRPNNLTHSQLRAIRYLQDHPDLEIKAADKGENIVLMTKTNYEKMVMNILRNKQWYSRIPVSSIIKFKNEYLSIIGSAHQKGLIDQDLHNYLKVRNSREATFNALLKVHKHPTMPPGRPIVSGIGSLTENAS